MKNTISNVQAMMRAIALGSKGRITAPPNPWVGCVIVKDGIVVGEGFHQTAGEPHAEIHALRQAKEQAMGATVYVTLEPCVHHGRTPPCSEALIKAKVSKVFIALEDPDPRVSGKGIAFLKDAGISVELGLCRDEAFQSLQPYLHHRKTSRPFCIAKAAISIDGRTAASDGTSKWITPKEARADSHRLRAESQAIMIGSGTAMADKPSLTVRDFSPVPEKQPVRVVLDSKGKVAASGPLFDTKLAPTLVLTTSRCHSSQIQSWEKAGVEVSILSEQEDGCVNIKEALALLGSRGIIQVLVEGGAGLHGSLLKQGLIDRLVIYTGALLLGEHGKPIFQGYAPTSINEAKRLKLESVQKIEDCIRAEYSFS